MLGVLVPPLVFEVAKSIVAGDVGTGKGLLVALEMAAEQKVNGANGREECICLLKCPPESKYLGTVAARMLDCDSNRDTGRADGI